MVKQVTSKLLASILALTMILIAFGQSSPAVQADENDVYDLVSYEVMRDHLVELTQIQAYSGWRNAGTSGEQEAFDYVEDILTEYEFLTASGMTVERQNFGIYSTMEVWESSLTIELNGASVDIPADAPRGSRDNATRLLQFDTDDNLNDTDANPISFNHPVYVVHEPSDLARLIRGGVVEDGILLVNYALIDWPVIKFIDASDFFLTLLDSNPAGLVFITEYSSKVGDSHGTNIGDVGRLAEIFDRELPPTLYARLEDFADAGISDWDGLTEIANGEITLDIDVLSPAQSSNLIAHLPGTDSSRALIVGASVDTPNTPGALDNGSGVVALLEILRVFNLAEVQPAIDIYVVWFGAEDIGFYGSAYFVTTHEALLDQTVAMFSVDSLTAPLDGVPAQIDLVTWSYINFDIYQTPWSTLVNETARENDIRVRNRSIPTIVSSNGSFNAFGIPNFNIIYQDLLQMTVAGGIEYAGNLHSPYDTLTLVETQAEAWVDMVRTALSAVLAGMHTAERLAPTSESTDRIVFVGTHLEATNMISTGVAEWGMSLAALGFDVDVIPYGQTMTAKDLAGATGVFLFPAYDYAEDDSYDVGWTTEESDIIEAYVNDGGFLVVSNMSHRINYDNRPADFNEDMLDMNVMTERYGVTFIEEPFSSIDYRVIIDSPLFDGVESIATGDNTAVRFVAENYPPLIGATVTQPLVTGFNYGENSGVILIVGDVGIFNTDFFVPGERIFDNVNLPMWENLTYMMIIQAEE